ncbi:MAG: hypothetical protein GTN36_00555 [Candidatus Aenigmarchaeota archaeon]|nr:hypothetical protein [Candidatus Aenigmarchaeota archaeon]
MVFEKFGKLKTKHQIMFAVLITFAVVAVWRGFWGLMDEYLFPENYQLSLWVSLIIGLVILTSTHYAVRELT